MVYDFSRCPCPDCDGTSEFIDEQMGETFPISNKPTPYAVRCHRHGKVYLSHHCYNEQMRRAHRGWECPMCPLYDNAASFDDDNYDEAMKELEDQEMTKE